MTTAPATSAQPAKPPGRQDAATSTPRPRPPRKRSPKKRKKTTPQSSLQRRVALIGIEIVGLAATAITAIMAVLGFSASRLTGTRFFSSLLPFALEVLALVILAAALLMGWKKLRTLMVRRSPLLPPIIALGLALVAGIVATQDNFSRNFGYFRTMVGGREEAGRVTLAHQVYAAYRRQDAAQLQQLVVRAQPFLQDIEAAAAAFALDPHLLAGVAATESSFLPRDSKDGGKGLFQITRVPRECLAEAGRKLGVDEPQIADHRHNAFIAAATLKHYLAEMKHDIFLGLLAYNIGPANGGLRFIMDQYGARDFVTIQPYLQQLPRDYPIRVLSHSLAFRIWRQEGRLIAYEEGDNALRIQRIGIPGLRD